MTGGGLRKKRQEKNDGYSAEKNGCRGSETLVKKRENENKGDL